MSTSSTAFQNLIVAQNYIFYLNYIIFIVGFIGNTLNILVFTFLKIFRGNRCAFFLIAESIVDIVLLFVIVIPEMFQMTYGTDPTNLSLFWCKIKTTASQSCRLLIASIVCFQALDQFLSTHHRFGLQQLLTLRLAQRIIWISFCLWILQSIPYIIFFQIVPPSGCIITSQALTYYYSYFYYPILNGLLPILISSLFSLSAYRNVRRLVRRQIPIERRRLDRQLTAMIFVRVIFFVILMLPYTIFRIYVLNVIVSPDDIRSPAINQLISTIVYSLLIWIYSLNFYIFLATSSRYRRQVKYFLVKKCWPSLKRRCSSNRNEVHPLGRVSIESGTDLE